MTHPYLIEIQPNEFGFVGEHPSIKHLCKIIEHLASSDASVNIQGESGTGKEFTARALHDYSFRKENLFFASNCGVFTESLLEAELFGAEKGRATGVDAYPGLLEQAHNGTLFLDEITEMPPRVQVALLRALQERKIVRIGGVASKPRDTNFRLVTASSRKLEGLLREDFYYRIVQVPIQVPSLRDRGSDIELLSKYFCGKESEKSGKEFYLYGDAINTLSNYHWPGNIRQLENSIIRVCALYGVDEEDKNNILYTRHFEFLNAKESDSKLGSLTQVKNAAVREAENNKIETILGECYGNISLTAKRLSVDRTHLRRKFRDYKIDPKLYKK